MSQTAALIAEQLEGWGFVPSAVSDVFEDPTPERIAATLDEFCRRSLGSSIERAELFGASVGSVHGLRLRDGRRVVVKVHRAETSAAFLVAMQTVQRALAAERFPCPEPLLGPTRLGRGIAVAEALLDRGGPADAHDPAVRRELARTLAWLVERCRPLVGLAGLRRGRTERRQGELWPRPHDGRFDFEATSAGAEWIDAVAAAARRVLDRSDASGWVVGHGDWRAGNVRFDGGKVSAAYDWDSLRIVREAELVGSVAHLFTADYAVADRRQVPTLDEALSFAADYEAARGKAFTGEEERVLRAALTYSIGYTARCEHSDRSTDLGRHAPVMTKLPSVPADSARGFLAAHAAELLDTTLATPPAVEPARSQPSRQELPSRRDRRSA